MRMTAVTARRSNEMNCSALRSAHDHATRQLPRQIDFGRVHTT